MGGGPAGLEPGEVEQRVDELEQPLGVAVDRVDALVLGGGQRLAVSASASSAGPMSSVSGVRSSWLTLVKKSVLAWSSSASVSARRRSAS